MPLKDNLKPPMPSMSNEVKRGSQSHVCAEAQSHDSIRVKTTPLGRRAAIPFKNLNMLVQAPNLLSLFLNLFLKILVAQRERRNLSLEISNNNRGRLTGDGSQPLCFAPLGDLLANPLPLSLYLKGPAVTYSPPYRSACPPVKVGRDLKN